MRNPLWRRIPKELKEELGKYIVIFLFMVITTGMVSGFMVAGESLKKTYDNTFDKYNVEDGHFDLSDEASDNMKGNIEDEGVKLYDMSYYELPMSKIRSDSDGNSGNVEGNAETKDDTEDSENDAADDAGKTGICRNAGSFPFRDCGEGIYQKDSSVKTGRLCTKTCKTGTDL